MKNRSRNKTLVYIITDSVTNSVFVSQVVTPLVKRLQYGHFTDCTLITFERKKYKALPQDIIDLLRNHNINLVVFPLGLYMGTWSMMRAIARLRRFLSTRESYALIARGPLAGLLARSAYHTHRCNKITIQARGLLAQEYAFTHQATTSMPLRYIHKLRFYLFEQLERTVYTTTRTAYTDIFFEVVSEALGAYLVQTFGTDPARIAPPPFDATPRMPHDEHAQFRAAKRAELGIAPEARVFTYCGSYKPWQCPDATIQFFKEQYQKDQTQLLLIITNDVAAFTQRLTQLAVDPQAYRIINKPHHEVLHYLAAADVGILFREHHILNWVSRPTKALEYKAARLEIVHNNTIACLQQKTPT